MIGNRNHRMIVQRLFVQRRCPAEPFEDLVRSQFFISKFAQLQMKFPIARDENLQRGREFAGVEIRRQRNDLPFGSQRDLAGLDRIRLRLIREQIDQFDASMPRPNFCFSGQSFTAEIQNKHRCLNFLATLHLRLVLISYIRVFIENVENIVNIRIFY